MCPLTCSHPLLTVPRKLSKAFCQEAQVWHIYQKRPICLWKETKETCVYEKRPKSSRRHSGTTHMWKETNKCKKRPTNGTCVNENHTRCSVYMEHDAVAWHTAWLNVMSGMKDDVNQLV